MRYHSYTSTISLPHTTTATTTTNNNNVFYFHFWTLELDSFCHFSFPLYQ